MIEKITKSKVFKKDGLKEMIKRITHYVFREKYSIFNCLKFPENLQLPSQI